MKLVGLALALIGAAMAGDEGSGARFLTRLDQFRRQLDGSQEDRLTEVLRQKEAPYVTDAPRAKWLPVEVANRWRWPI